MNDDPLFARIASAASKLNQAADQATAYLKAVEDRLSGLGAGFEVIGEAFWCGERYSYGEDDRFRETRSSEKRIGYARIGGSWRLISKTVVSREVPSNFGGSEWEDIDYTDEPLLDTDRETRCLAVTHVPNLLERIARQLEEASTEVAKVASVPQEMAPTRKSTLGDGFVSSRDAKVTRVKAKDKAV